MRARKREPPDVAGGFVSYAELFGVSIVFVTCWFVFHDRYFFEQAEKAMANSTGSTGPGVKMVDLSFGLVKGIFDPENADIDPSLLVYGCVCVLLPFSQFFLLRYSTRFQFIPQQFAAVCEFLFPLSLCFMVNLLGWLFFILPGGSADKQEALTPTQPQLSRNKTEFAKKGEKWLKQFIDKKACYKIEFRNCTRAECHALKVHCNEHNETQQLGGKDQIYVQQIKQEDLKNSSEEDKAMGLAPPKPNTKKEVFNMVISQKVPPDPRTWCNALLKKNVAEHLHAPLLCFFIGVSRVFIVLCILWCLSLFFRLVALSSGFKWVLQTVFIASVLKKEKLRELLPTAIMEWVRDLLPKWMERIQMLKFYYENKKPQSGSNDWFSQMVKDYWTLETELEDEVDILCVHISKLRDPNTHMPFIKYQHMKTVSMKDDLVSLPGVIWRSKYELPMDGRMAMSRQDVELFSPLLVRLPRTCSCRNDILRSILAAIKPTADHAAKLIFASQGMRQYGFDMGLFTVPKFVLLISLSVFTLYRKESRQSTRNRCSLVL
jgi:hypothetical protein